nr:cell wall transcription factor ace2 [Quercus suber]
MNPFECSQISGSQQRTHTMPSDTMSIDPASCNDEISSKGQDDWNPMFNPSAGSYSSTMAPVEPMWHFTQVPQGLGLMFPQMASCPTFDGIAQNVRQVTMPYWVPDWAVTHAPIPQSMLARKDSWNAGSDAASTQMPPVWEPFDVTAAVLDYDTSSLSSDSASPHSSAASSPHACSETATWVAGSPAIKTEDHPSPLNTYETYLHDRGAPDQSLVMGCLETVPQTKTEEKQAVTHMDWNSCTPSDPKYTCDDYKPVLNLQHDLRHDEDTKKEIDLKVLAVRPKRQFTNAGNAVCRCDECGLLFRRRYNMKAHMKTRHTNQTKPHACGFADCQWGFHRKTDLNRHERTVSTAFDFSLNNQGLTVD